MIEDIVIGRECRLDVGEIQDPTRQLVDLTGDMNLCREGMTVESSAFVTLWDVRQAMRRFKNELFENLHTDEIIQQHGLWK